MYRQLPCREFFNRNKKARLFRAVRQGLTLIEVMIAAVVLFLVAVGILETMIQAYRLTLLTRTSDNARAILVALGDQFSRGAITTDPVTGNPNGIWEAALTDTGVGLTWQTTAGPLVGTAAGGLQLDLGGANSSTIPSQIFRHVYYLPTPLNPSAALTQNALSTVTATNMTAASLVTNSDIITATFTILFTVNGQQKSQSLTVARIWRNANS